MSNNHRTGAPIVLLHGLLGDRHDWQALIEALPKRQLIALDLPGHGQSTHHAVSDFASTEQWLRQTLQQLGISRYWLVGYSLGGRLALYHASQQPAGLLGLWLENCHPGLPPAARPDRWQHDKQWATRFANEPLPLVLDDWYQQAVFADLDAASRQQLIIKRGHNHGPAIAHMLTATSLAKQPDLAPWFAKADIAIAYLSGRQDQKFHQLACQLAACHRKINHLELDGGHNLHVSQTQTYAQLLNEWVHQQEEKRHD